MLSREIELKKRDVSPVLNYLWIENLARPGKFIHDLTRENTQVAYDKGSSH